MYVVDWIFEYYSPIIARRAVMGFSFTSSTHPLHSSYTVSTAHASRTHVKALQTDFHVKPDNSSGSTHDSPSERPLRTKVTFQPKQAPKSSKESHASPNRERTDQAKQRTNSPPCLEPWKKLRIIRSDSMAQHCRHRKLRSLVYRDRFPSLSLERKTSSFFLSLCISSILSTTIPIYIYIEPQFLQWGVVIFAVVPL